MGIVRFALRFPHTFYDPGICDLAATVPGFLVPGFNPMSDRASSSSWSLIGQRFAPPWTRSPKSNGLAGIPSALPPPIGANFPNPSHQHHPTPPPPPPDPPS